MALRKFVPGVVATVAATAVAIAGAGSAGASEDTPVTTDGVIELPVDEVVGETSVEAAAEGLVDTLATAYETAYLDDAPELVEDILTDGIDAEAPLTATGEQSVDGMAESIAAEAVAVTSSSSASDVVIDEVLVEQVGDVEVLQTDPETVTVTTDVQITRHIEEGDIEWIEVIPHEMVLDAETGEVQEVIVHDLEWELENQTPEPVMDNRLMGIPDQQTQAEPTALSTANRGKVSAYAVKYGIHENPNYYKYPSDCTNFVSQAMYAGGWKEVSHPWVDYKQNNAWWYGGVPRNSWSWSGAENFYRMTKALGRTTAAKRVSDLRVGDLLQYGATPGVRDHSMVVTGKVNSTIYLTYHSRNTVNKPFTALSGMKVTWYGHFV